MRGAPSALGWQLAAGPHRSMSKLSRLADSWKLQSSSTTDASLPLSYAAGGAVPLTSASVTLPASYPAGAARRLRDFNSLDDPPKTSAVQWAWLEVRVL